MHKVEEKEFIGLKAPRLSIVIPAYNEEGSIQATVEQTLEVLPEIVKEGRLAGAEVIIVDDGSRDATAERLKTLMAKHGSSGALRTVCHEINRGYGAAIKTGFAVAQGDLLGFMDADGTCEPATFSALCRAIEDRQADVVLGSRMIRAGSGMPLSRRIGNRMFAMLLSLIGSARVTDSASGMRVLRRDRLPLLSPLPDGLHFTPAMSARAVLDPNLKIVEVPMAYHQRVGDSKLGVVKDGLRFLAVILEIALTYRPLRFFGLFALVFLAVAVWYGVYPVVHFIRERQIFEWMIYRLLAVTVFTVAGLNLGAIGLLANSVVRSFQRLHCSAVSGPAAVSPGAPRRWQRKALDGLPALGALLALIGVVVNGGVLWEYLTTGHITAHWTYPVAGAFFVLSGLQLFSFGVIHRIFRALEDRQTFLFPPKPIPPKDATPSAENS